MKPRLTLVGAGPGDATLITLKGIQALEQADVVLYDELASSELLQYAPRNAFKMYVGKKMGTEGFSQIEINQHIVRLAKKRGHVVRLKGGDPFVFGRGHEELSYAEQHQIPTTVVPGISSCISVPEAAGIPVTRRGYSRSFWVITGTTQDGELCDDLYLAAQSKATVVVLMGLHKIKEICAIYQKFGRGHLPVAVIQNGTKESQKLAIGQVWEINRLVQEKGIGAPAVMIFGEVVTLQPSYMIEYLNQQSLLA
ncbi:uroporphyrinogen-III C-methyltransferase [Dyadobacter tibetensis]|uniref:uroporphyrinogen-III C-methyltransferase n=1 Tax=Dyadobacter tibetensis TaxID=1211851 RepID=UPI000471CB6F|nr:uroporphyrinogen-III C-methyltransferase [Dyadobacter tibetensis]